jgi:hypothetical protein
MELDKPGVEDGETSRILEAYSTRRVVGGAFYTFQGGAARALGLEIEESESPSRLVQVVPAAEMIRVYRQDTSLSLEGFRQDQLDVIGGGELDDTAKGVQRVELLLDAGYILPPGEPPGVERETLAGWGSLEPLAMQIRWWQRGLLRPLEDLEEA